MEKDEKEVINQNLEEKEIKKSEEVKIEEVETIEKKDENKEIAEKEDVEKEEKELTSKENNKENVSKNTKKNSESKKEKNTEETKKDNKDNKEKAKHVVKKKSSAITIIFIMIILVLLLFLSTIFAILNMGSSNIVKGVYIEDVDVSNLNKESLNNIVKDKISNIQEEIELIYGEYSTIVKLEEIGLEVNTKEAINEALTFGRTDNIIIDNYSILIASIFNKKIELDIKIDEEKFNQTVKNIQAEIPEAIKEYSYDIKEDKLIVTNGKSGQKIISNELKNRIIANIREQFNGKTSIISIPTKKSEPKVIDIKKIYNEIYKQSKDAYIIEEPFQLYKEEEGVDFAITLEEAKSIIKENKETYTIPLKITEPKVKVKDLGDKLFKQTLAKYTTIYDAGNTNRSHNIALAAKTINGTILMPGETFSYNGVLGNTNKEKGYKLGTAYVGGKVVESYGGGICQVSSTLYNSVLYANLEIVERHNHSYVVNYVPAGRDATVAYGGKNFKFKNTRNYPIKIVASAKNGVVSISIMGIKEEKEYEVVLTSSVLSTTPRSVVYENNSKMDEGTQKIIQKGYDGKKSIAYKVLKYNGKTISKTVLSKDTYKPMTQIIQVGTKKVIKPVVTPTDTPATEI